MGLSPGEPWETFKIVYPGPAPAQACFKHVCDSIGLLIMAPGEDGNGMHLPIFDKRIF